MSCHTTLYTLPRHLQVPGWVGTDGRTQKSGRESGRAGEWTGVWIVDRRKMEQAEEARVRTITQAATRKKVNKNPS